MKPLLSICPGAGAPLSIRTIAGAAPPGNRACHRIGLVLGRTVGLADLDLALWRALPGAALLCDVRELMRHQAKIGGRLAGTEEYIAAMGKRARAHGVAGLVRHAIVMDPHAAEIGAEMRADLRRDAGVDRRARALGLDRSGGRVLHRRRGATGAHRRCQRWIRRLDKRSLSDGPRLGLNLASLPLGTATLSPSRISSHARDTNEPKQRLQHHCSGEVRRARGTAAGSAPRRVAQRYRRRLRIPASISQWSHDANCCNR
jgi:hypothetical protein